MKKRDWIIVGLIVCAAIVLFAYLDRAQILDMARAQSQKSLPAPVAYDQTKSLVGDVRKPQEQKPVSVGTVPTKTETAKPILATEINLAVPFTSQAPTGNWKQPFQDACEEASVLMVREYYAGNKLAVIDPVSAEKSLLAIVALENKMFGYYLDTTVSETAQFAERMYGFASTEVLENPTIDQIKEKLNQGDPVLVPAAGQLLKNPYFTAPGPLYHMLVIRGYTKTNQFIVNDPGTKRGASYLYSFDTIMNAMHDWNKDGDILKGKKAVFILHPKK